MTVEPITHAQTLARSVGRCSGTLILLPILVLFFGTDWRVSTEVGFSSGTRVTDSQSTSIELAFLPDETMWDAGVVLDTGSYLQLFLPRSMDEFTLTLQADHNDQYRVSASVEGDRFDDLWTAPQIEPADGMQTRGPILFALPTPIRFLRIHPLGGDQLYSVSGVSLEEITSVGSIRVSQRHFGAFRGFSWVI